LKLELQLEPIEILTTGSDERIKLRVVYESATFRAGRQGRFDF
jgi:hypothetical protein